MNCAVGTAAVIRTMPLGSPRWVRTMVSAISASITYDDQGNEIGSIGFAKDIRDIRRRDQLVTLCDSATVAPAIVQNRCYARTGWDQEVRRVCRERGMVYQGFSLLTANQRELGGATAAAIARRLGATIPQVVFRFAFAVGMVALTGTSDRTHMQQDLAAVDLAITESDVAALERLR